jgi:O-antigen/teichoic acid export membrane protein
MKRSFGKPAPPGTEEDGSTPIVARGSYGRGVGFGAFSFLANALLSLAASVAVARLYGIAVVGEFALAGAPAGTVWLLSTVREQPALMRRLAPLQPRDSLVTGLFAAVLSFSFLLTAGVSVLVGLATLVLFTGPIGRPDLVAPAEAMLVGSLLFQNTCWNLDTVLSAFRAGAPLFWSRFHQALVYLLAAVVLSGPLPTVWGVILAWYGSWATALVQRSIHVRAFMRLRVPAAELRRGMRTLPELLRFGIRLTPGFLAEGLSDESGIWILGLLTPIQALGAYSRAWMIARRGLELNYRVTEMLFPTLVERRLAQDHAGFDHALVDSLRYVAIAMLLPAAVAAGAALPIMRIYGPGFASGAGCFAYLVFVPGILTLCAVQSHALFTEGQGLLSSLYGAIRLVATLLATVLLTRAYGLSGAGAGMAIGACAQLVPLSANLPRLLSQALHRLWSPREVLALVVAGGLGFAVSRVLSVELAQPLALVLAPTAGLAAAATAFTALGGPQRRDRERLRRLTAALASRRGRRQPAPPLSGPIGMGPLNPGSLDPTSLDPSPAGPSGLRRDSDRASHRPA